MSDVSDVSNVSDVANVANASGSFCLESGSNHPENLATLEYAVDIPGLDSSAALGETKEYVRFGFHLLVHPYKLTHSESVLLYFFNKFEAEIQL